MTIITRLVYLQIRVGMKYEEQHESLVDLREGFQKKEEQHESLVDLREGFKKKVWKV